MTPQAISRIGHNSSNPIDELGAIKAELAALNDRAKPLEAEIKAMGPGTHPGQLFDANVAEVAESQSPDPAAMEEKLRGMGVDDRWFSRNMKTRAASLRLTVKARR